MKVFTDQDIEKFKQEKLSRIQKMYGNSHPGTLNHMVNEVMDDNRNNKVVSTQGYTWLELEMAFEKIKNLDNWKMPIDAIIDRKYFDICSEAAAFYTGSHRELSKSLPKFMIRVSAPGYYACIGA